MKIKVFICTYNSKEYLDKNLRSLVGSDLLDHDYEITILNNHTQFHLAEDLAANYNIRVIENQGRADWSTGHLARSWNQAIIHGFKSLSSPDCDILVHAQDDLTWSKNWTSFIIEAHKKYSFLTFGTGDGVCSYLPEAVRKIGMWDERFCGLGCQGGDYFLRALKFNRDKSSINDVGHVRILNPLEGNYGGKWEKGGNRNVCDTPRHEDGGDAGMTRWVEHNRSKTYHEICRMVFSKKWNQGVAPHGGHILWEVDWTIVDIDNPPEIHEPQDVYYPYFEADIINLPHPAYKLHL
jgi:hypothetical protein